MPDSLTVWRFVDGKPGHENQSLGMVRALAEQVELRVDEIPVKRGWRSLADWLLKRCPNRPAGHPDLLIGAGHATHLPMLACRRACGGRTLVLMKPSLPVAWFDLCVVPEHDHVPASERVLVTRGVLNPVRPSTKAADAPELILLGGPSGEYAWDEAQIVEQVQLIADKADSEVWIMGSRRTPVSTLAQVREIAGDSVKVIPQEQTQPGFLAGELARTKRVWISEDSVSMIYEALTAGAACGLLSVPKKQPGRVAAGVQKLVEQSLVTRFDAWQAGEQLQAPAEPFNEAARAARWVMQRV